MEKLNVGGQALIEGVMMKSEKYKAIAVRKKDNEILVTSEDISSKKNRLKKIPFIRGIFVLFESMAEGTKDINYAASFYEDDEEQNDGWFEKTMVAIFRENADKAASAISMVLAFALAIGLFIVLPAFLVRGQQSQEHNVVAALKEGLIKMSLFVMYIYAISMIKDIKRVFQYHGAEHKSIFAYEKNLPLTVENVRSMPRLHPRCGTNFIFVVLLMSALVFSLVTFESVLQRSLLKLIFMPLVAGFSYEIIRLAGKRPNVFTKIVIFPGLMLQKITTKEPDDSQIEVAIAALKAAIAYEESSEKEQEITMDEQNEMLRGPA